MAQGRDDGAVWLVAGSVLRRPCPASFVPCAEPSPSRDGPAARPPAVPRGGRRSCPCPRHRLLPLGHTPASPLDPVTGGGGGCALRTGVGGSGLHTAHGGKVSTTCSVPAVLRGKPFHRNGETPRWGQSHSVRAHGRRPPSTTFGLSLATFPRWALPAADWRGRHIAGSKPLASRLGTRLPSVAETPECVIACACACASAQ